MKYILWDNFTYPKPLFVFYRFVYTFFYKYLDKSVKYILRDNFTYPNSVFVFTDLPKHSSKNI